jgi:hypothetical protein
MIEVTQLTTEEPEMHDDVRPSELSGKKERVLHTRVPAVLERELRRFADGLRVPVSNLVRTILEDAVKAADVATENVEGKLKRAAEQLEHERERFGERLRRRASKEALGGVFAFQAVRLARASHCARCERDLAAGEDAFLGLTDPAPEPVARVFVCAPCLPKQDPKQDPKGATS